MILLVGFATLQWSFTWSDRKNYNTVSQTHTRTHTHIHTLARTPCQPLPSLTSDHLTQICRQSVPQNKAHPLEQDFLV